MLDIQSASVDQEQLLHDILTSRHFKKSPRLRDFLNYICERAARQLRQKLELYNLDEGAAGDWRLTIPRGTYIPLFERNGLPPEAVPPSVLPRRLLLGLGAAAAGGLLLWGLVSLAEMMRPRTLFWRTVLTSNQAALLVSGDSGLPILQSETHHLVHVQEYAAGKFVSQEGAQPSGEPRATYWRRRYTSVADMIMAVKTSSLAEKLSRPLEIKYARDISLQDLKSGNAILVGGPAGNPWVELYAKQLNFDFQIDEATYVSTLYNRAPEGHEEASYRAFPGDPKSRAYAIIALTRGLDGHSRVLLLEGTSVAGTDAAVDFLFNSDRFPEVLKSAIHGLSIDDFEVLLETENVAASGTQMKVVGFRTHPH